MWILKELRREAGMEAFNRIFDGGKIAESESTLPPMTGPAWSAIYTGTEPSVHGVPDFFVMKRDYTPDIVLYDSLDVPPFWKTLSDEGKRSLVITPAEETNVNGIENVDIITGFPLPAKTNSPKLRRLMARYNFRGEPNIEADIKSGKMPVDVAVKHFARSVRSRSGITRDMLDSGEAYDLVFVCFTETDRIQHFLLNQKDWKKHLLPIYQEYSTFLSYLLKRVEEEDSALIILSDHGSQPIYNKFLMNSWLVQNGYLQLKEKVKSSISAENGASVGYGIREKLLKTRLRGVYDKLPYPVKRFVFRVLDIFFQGISSGDYARLHLFDYDMRKSSAFAAISNDPVTTIWINDSRFANGIISGSRKEKAKRELIERLSKVKSREGDAMFANIIDGRNYYRRTNKFIAPDIIVEAKKGYTIDIFNYSAQTNFMRPESAKGGDHSRKAIFGYYGKSVSINLERMNVLDVHDIVLSYFGVGRSKRLRLKR